MLALHVAVCFIALFAGAIVLTVLVEGRHQTTWAAGLLLSAVLISLTGFALPSPPGTPTPDPARIVGVSELVVAVIAALAIYVRHLGHAWRGIYVVAIVLSVYFNAFVAVTQAFLKIGFSARVRTDWQGAAVPDRPAGDVGTIRCHRGSCV